MSAILSVLKNDETTIESLTMDEYPCSLDLHQELPLLFAERLTGFLGANDEPMASLYVPPEEILNERVPARALVLTESGVLFLEDGEALLGNTSWGVKSLFFPYPQITAVGIGTALLSGRFTLHGTGSAPLCEFTLHSDDVQRFEKAARMIGELIAA